MTRVIKHRQQRNVVLIADMESHAAREVCQGAAEYIADKPDLNFIIWSTLRGGRLVRKRQMSRRAGGLLLWGPKHSQIFGDDSHLRPPHVYILENDPSLRAPVIGLDERAIGQMAAVHLLERGYRKLAFVGSTSFLWSRLRGQGFVRAARDHGAVVQVHELPLDVLPVYWSFLPAKSRHALRQVLMAIPKPCGTLAANDAIASFLIESARRYGVTVPDRAGIIGVDDDPIANASAKLSISSVQVPFREVGRMAAETLHRLMEGQGVPPRRMFPPMRVVVRASTHTFRVEDPLLQRALFLIESQRHRQIRVGEIVRSLSTTPVTLGHRFARHLAVTPSRYILRRRIEYAKDLLRAGTLNVSEVSEACQFHSCSYFCQIFKSVTGVSPRSFRLKSMVPP